MQQFIPLIKMIYFLIQSRLTINMINNMKIENKKTGSTKISFKRDKVIRMKNKTNKIMICNKSIRINKQASLDCN